MTPFSDSQNYKNLTSTATVFTGAGGLKGIFVASASSNPTIKVEDTDGTTAATIVNTFTPTGPAFYEMPFKFVRGLKITIAGTVDCSVAWSPG